MICNNENYYIGLDIGGTKCAATLGREVNENLDICDKEKFLTDGLSPDEILEKFSSFIDGRKNTLKICGIGISCGGPLDSKSGIIMSPPSLPSWCNIKVVDYFERKYGIKTFLQNDANACAVAEWRYGAGKGSQNMVFLTFGTGFGAGLILNGKLYSGTNDNAGEIGHIRLTKNGPVGYHKAGSCEGYCSGSGITRLAEIFSKKEKYKQSYEEFMQVIKYEKPTAENMSTCARNGNVFCEAVYKKSGEMLGRTLSIIVDLLNPEKIVIGGVFMRAVDLLYPSCKKIMERECLSFSLKDVEVLPAGLKENIGDYAALSVAKGDF